MHKIKKKIIIITHKIKDLCGSLNIGYVHGFHYMDEEYKLNQRYLTLQYITSVICLPKNTKTHLYKIRLGGTN